MEREGYSSGLNLPPVHPGSRAGSDDTIGPHDPIFHTKVHSETNDIRRGKNDDDPASIPGGSVPPGASFDPIGPSSSYSVQFD